MTDELTQIDLDFLLNDSDELGDKDGKKCSKCTKFLPLSSFNFASGGNYLRAECRKCNNEMAKIRASLRAEFGMPTAGYICPICKGSEEDVKGKGNTRNGSWVLDHCHESGDFRGWLCHKCNRALGGFDDNESTLNNAIKYLRGNDK
jgi:hypothetical protein